jgi:uncharacterized membrane protein (UPF0136 family)
MSSSQSGTGISRGVAQIATKLLLQQQEQELAAAAAVAEAVVAGSTVLKLIQGSALPAGLGHNLLTLGVLLLLLLLLQVLRQLHHQHRQ